MARRRMIDPNIWASEDMAKLTHRQRLLVIGLFSNADDHGKGIAKPAYIRSTIFPYDDIPINEIIDDLETIRAVISIRFYEVKGNSYFIYSNWLKWQTVQKPQPSIIPDPVENDSVPIPEPFSPKGKEEKGKEGKGEEKGREGNMPAPDSNPHKDHILKLINECKIEDCNLFDLETVYSFIGVVDIEVIEAAIKKGQGKQHINYVIRTLQGMIRDGIKTKEQLRPAMPNVTPFNRSGASGKPKIAAAQSKPGAPPTEEELEHIRQLAKRIQEGRPNAEGIGHGSSA